MKLARSSVAPALCYALHRQQELTILRLIGFVFDFFKRSFTHKNSNYIPMYIHVSLFLVNDNFVFNLNSTVTY